MSEAWASQRGEGAGTAIPAAVEGPSAGALLRRAREASGLHIGALAVSLKVPVRKLEALEEGRYEQLPDLVFARALASSICRTLKIEPGPVLDRLPQTAPPRLVRDSDGINAPFRAPSDHAAPAWRDQLTRPVSLAVMVLLVGALVLVLLPAARQDAPAVGVAKNETANAVTTTVETASTAPAPAPETAAESAPAGAVMAVSTQPAAASPAVAAAPPTAMPLPFVQVPGTSANGLLMFRAKGATWIEVIDAKGVVAVRKILAAGEAAGASGALPLQVTIGRVDATEVQLRGKPYDLTPVSRDNVARFEVK